MKCQKCGVDNKDNANFCVSCGEVLPSSPPETVSSSDLNASIRTTETKSGDSITNINVQVPQGAKNYLGVTGFVLALIGLFLCWIPILGWLLWILGAIFSVIGLFRTPRGFAIAGTVISFIDIILLLLVIGGCTAIGAGIGAGMGII